MQPSIYLAGPITGLTYGESAETWRAYVKDRMKDDVRCFSPLRAQEHLRNHGVLLSSSYEENCMTSADGIMVRDHWDVQNTDMTFACLLGAPRISIGTVMELGFAYAHRKPVILVMEKTGNVHEHVMVRKAGVFATESLDEGIELARAILFPC